MAPSPSPAAHDDELARFQRAIRDQYDFMENTWQQGRTDELVDRFYAPATFAAHEGMPEVFIDGIEQMREVTKVYQADLQSVRFESVRSHVRGDMGWDWFNFHIVPRPDKASAFPPSPVRILFLWERIEGQWKCAGEVQLMGRFPTGG